MHSRGHDEDDLLERLRQALTPAARWPSSHELRSLIRAVAKVRLGDAPPTDGFHDPTALCRRIIDLPPMILRPVSASTMPRRAAAPLHQVRSQQ